MKPEEGTGIKRTRDRDMRVKHMAEWLRRWTLGPIGLGFESAPVMCRSLG
jgi:hypothetical protein